MVLRKVEKLRYFGINDPLHEGEIGLSPGYLGGLCPDGLPDFQILT